MEPSSVIVDDLSPDIKTEAVLNEVEDYTNQKRGRDKLWKLADKFTGAINHRISAERNAIRKKLKQHIEDMNRHLEEVRGSVDSHYDTLVAHQKRFEKKYEGMYSYLIKSFLVNLEQRVFTNELFTQGVLDVVVRKLHKLEIQASQLEGLLNLAYIREETGETKEEWLAELTKNVAKVPDWDTYLKETAATHEQAMNALYEKVADQQQKEAEEAKKQQGIAGEGDGQPDSTNNSTAGSGDFQEAADNGEGSGAGQEDDSEDSGAKPEADSGQAEQSPQV